MFRKVLIANRGEIAVRVITACQELGITAVAVYSEADRGALHVRMADEAYCIGPAPAAKSYLHISAIIEAALACHAEAIHPGYGFLAENVAFAEACAEAGIVFIGPPPSAIRLMGSKIAAKRAVEAAGVPTVPGYYGDRQDDEILARAAEHIGYPLMIKASAGGGGKGMRMVERPEMFRAALAAARREAKAAFGDDTVFLEKLLVNPRHIEFQILADHDGQTIHLGERDCSIQRRHQKVVEESPSVVLTPSRRAEMGEAAVRAAQAAGYVNAGTVEFLYDEDGNYYFLEMNTRLQVEHPVTEMVTGLDLVKHQLAIAARQPLGIRQEQIVPRGHAIEVRLYAEDPENQYLPSIGKVRLFQPPIGPGLRTDAGIASGDEVTVYYDPMLAKIIAHGADRREAIARLQWGLAHTVVLGVKTNLALLQAILADADFQAGNVSTSFLQTHALLPAVKVKQDLPLEVLLAAAGMDLPPASRPTASRGLAAGAVSNPWRTLGPWQQGGEYTFRYYYHGSEQWVTLSRAIVDGDAWLATAGTGGVAAAITSVEGLRVRFERPSSESIIVHQSGRRQLLHVARQGDILLVACEGQSYTLEPARPPDVAVAAQSAGAIGVGRESLTAPMTGTVIKINVREGDMVKAGEILVVLGAMKMEHAIAAAHRGVVKRIHCTEGETVEGGTVLVEVEEI
jgi:3-methylcrotonyl-CoA carboxylase alpha subunit